MIQMFVSALIGALASMVLTTAVELWKGRGRRRLFGQWWAAVQPVYYRTGKWHVQKVRIRPSILGIVIDTMGEKEKLQWRMHAKLTDRRYLVGSWRSLRPGSISSGYMTVQLSLNGRFMCGHIYGDVTGNQDSNFGILIFGRTEADLRASWLATSTGLRPALSLDETIDFIGEEKSLAGSSTTSS